MTNPRFRALVESHGVPFHPIGSERDAERTEAHPDLWHPIRGLGVLWRHLCVPALRPSFDRIIGVVSEGADRPVVLASPLALGARMARDAVSFRLISGYLAPMNLRSSADPMRVAGHTVPHWAPHALRRGLWRLLDRMKLEPMARPGLARWREELGLPSLPPSIFGQWMHSPDGGVALFPRSFGPNPGDWPLPVTHCGFANLPATGRLDPDVDAFLRAGDAPVVVFPGSAARSPTRFLRLATDAVRRHAQRLIVVMPRGEELPWVDAAGQMQVRSLSFLDAFPAAAAVIHHGGVGTCGQALLCGPGQVILPSAYDQFDNAARVESLGRGCWAPLERTEPRRMDQMLEEALTRRGRPIPADIHDDGAAAAADFIEGPKRKPPSRVSESGVGDK